jgi:HEAT repeat protein
MKINLRFYTAAFITLFFGISAYSEPLPVRSDGRLPPYPDKYINVAGHTVEYDKDLPKSISDELRAKKENAVDDIVKVYEQVDWSLYSDAACLDKFLIEGLNDIMCTEMKSNKKARLKLKDILDKNPDSNAKWILIALIQNEKIKDADLIQTIVNFSTDTDKNVRYEVIRFLLNQNDPLCLAHFRKILASEQDKCLRVIAAEGLAALDDQSGYDEISKALNDSDVEVRIIAYRSLGELKTAKARALAEQAIIKAGKTETNSGARAEIVNSLRMLTGRQPNEIRYKYFGEKFE